MEFSGDPLSLLGLQIDWGADEALAEMPVNRIAPVTTTEAGPATRSPLSPVAPPAPDLRAEATRNGPAITATTLDELLAAIRDFQGCGLRDTATHPVLPTGTPTGGLLVIGDPPVAEDDRSGRPFSGPAGVVLDRILSGLGWARADILLAPLIPWRPPGNRPPTDAELAQCLPLLHRLIALSRPKRMILTGILPVRSLLGGDITLRRHRGQWKDFMLSGLPAAIPTLPSFSLAGLKTAADRRAVWADWRLLHRSINLKS